MLGVSPDTVRRWARQGRLGVLRPSGEYKFEVAELKRWAHNQGMRLSDGSETIRLPRRPDPGTQPLAAALARGSVLHEVEGGDPDTVLANLVELVLPDADLDRAALLDQLLDRERMASTGLGGGVALPHPRTPSSDFVVEPTVVIAMLAGPVDWNALDAAPVRTAILLLSPSPQLHLQVLSRLAFVLRDEGFQKLLAGRGEADAVRRRVAELEPTGA